MKLLESLQKYFNYPPLKTVDPNTGEIKTDAPVNLFAQAAIPIVITGLFRFTRSDNGAGAIAQSNSPDWVETIFGNKAPEVIQRITEYCSGRYDTVKENFQTLTGKAVSLISEAAASHHDKTMFVKEMLAAESASVLTYLPASLRTGDLVNDNTVDDKTHKMQGPISTFMHTVEKVFTSSDPDHKKDNSKK